MKTLHPPAYHLDVRDHYCAPEYRKMLESAKLRQRQRDEESDAYIDNAFYGQLYISIFDEYPWLGGDIWTDPGV